jgi:hypothetical protein
MDEIACFVIETVGRKRVRDKREELLQIIFLLLKASK